MRRAALILKTNPKTVARKLKFLGNQSANQLRIARAKNARPLQEIQFDELETFEHTKMKPLSVALAVDATTRTVLGFRACRMPAKGPLAERSRKKYGHRPDERPKNLALLLEQTKPWVSGTTLIRSDSNPYYAKTVRNELKGSVHLQELSRRGRVTGLGELKRGGYDPLFALNHTCAMLRANINRLFRRTWCTTKKLEALKAHLAIYVCFHNQRLVDTPSTGSGSS